MQRAEAQHHTLDVVALAHTGCLPLSLSMPFVAFFLLLEGSSQLVESLRQILDEIGEVFASNAQTDQAI